MKTTMFVGLAVSALTACSAAPEGGIERNSTFDGACLEFFRTKSPAAGDVVVRDSWEKRGVIVVEIAKPSTAVNPIAKGAVPDSPAAAKHAAPVSPAVAHCLVNPEDGSLRLASEFDHSWEKDAT